MTDEAAFLATILANPQDDGPRKVYADWLEERGQCERAEFIRCQVELARLEPAHVIVGAKDNPTVWVPSKGGPDYCEFWSYQDIPIGTIVDVWWGEYHRQPTGQWSEVEADELEHGLIIRRKELIEGSRDERWNYTAKHHHVGPWPGEALRHREAELLAATTSEPCPRCKGNGFEFGLPEKVKMPVVIDDVNGRVYMVPDKFQLPPSCLQCGGKKTVPGQSNAVKWAGKLAGREAIALDRPNEFVERANGWHVRWLKHYDNISDHEIFGRFLRGFIGAVSLTTQALMGERCQACEGAGRHLERRASHMSSAALEIGADSEETGYTCQFCHGSGYVGGLRAELARFPLTEVRLSDKRPWNGGHDGAIGFWWWAAERTNQPDYIEESLYLLLEGHEEMAASGLGKKYASSSAAEQALSDAVVRWVRKQAVELVTC